MVDGLIQQQEIAALGDQARQHQTGALPITEQFHRPQRIIHLAALPIADLSHTHSDEAIRSILHGTVNVLETLRDADFVERFIYTSSSMVYGDFQFYSANEEHPKNPKDIYGGTKLAGEILTQSFSRRFGIEYTIIRPSAVYGPTDVNRRVSGIFIENARRGEELVLHGGGGAKLDFTYVKDTAHGFVLATLAEEARNELDRTRMLAQRVGLGPFAKVPPGFIAGQLHSGPLSSLTPYSRSIDSGVRVVGVWNGSSR